MVEEKKDPICTKTTNKVNHPINHEKIKMFLINLSHFGSFSPELIFQLRTCASRTFFQLEVLIAYISGVNNNEFRMRKSEI